jgi:biotin carboxylase
MPEPKTIMVVAGGPWQVPLIRKAKAFGFKVINTNLYEDSPGFEDADLGVVADVLDRAANLAIAKEHVPDAVITDQSDIAVPTVAYLCEQLGLPGIGVDCANRFTNKLAMRGCCEEFGLPNPAFQSCRTLDELVAFRDRVGGCLVIKPTNNQGSRGVIRVDKTGRLDSALDTTGLFTRNGRVLAEEFIDGLEITVEGIQLPGRHYTLAMSTKQHFDHNPMVARRLYYAPSHDAFDQEALRAQHDRFIENMRLPFGITHSEYKLSNGKFYLVETAARGGGNKISSHIVPRVSGVDTYALLLQMALGEDPGALQPAPSGRHLMLEFLDFGIGKVAGIEGLDEAKKQEGVIDLIPFFKPGEVLALPINDPARHMHLIIEADSLEQLEARIARVRDTVEVHYA